MQAIFVGELVPGSTSSQRFEAIKRLGIEVFAIPTRDDGSGFSLEKVAHKTIQRAYQKNIDIPFNVDYLKVNRQLAKSVSAETSFVWLDKANTIKRDTLARIKDQYPTCKIIGFSPDDMGRRHNRSRDFENHASLYDFFFSNKTTSAQALNPLGCKSVHFVGNSFDPTVHRPIAVAPQERYRLGGKVGFIGTYEESRAQMIAALGQAGVPVRIWGTRWPSSYKPDNVTIEGRPLYGDDYVKALRSFDINLCFLRKINGDLQTTRSIEIPATASFMMAERTAEHEQLFSDGHEAVFFSSTRELIERCEYYLSHPLERESIAENGFLRCIKDGYSIDDHLRRMFDISGIELPPKKSSEPSET